MRKIRIIEQISLDGVIQAPGARNQGGDDYRYGGWTASFRNHEVGEAVAEAQGTGFDLLLGRKTYDVFAGYWPNAGDGLISNGLNAATKYVVTHRRERLPWGPVGDLGSDAMDGIRKLKSKEGPDLVVWGGGSLTTSLLDAGLADELILLVYPLLLGTGKRLFENGIEGRQFSLVSTRRVGAEIIMSRYRYDASL